MIGGHWISRGTAAIVGAATVALLAASCGDDSGTVAVPGRPDAVKTTASLRAERRLFDGAPPVVPHGDFGAACLECHNTTGVAVEGVGFSPPQPHGDEVEGRMSRCTQCHVFAATAATFRSSTFEGLAQDLRKGERLFVGAPPVIPHPLLLRENCMACHTGPAAREEIRCSHPERDRCQQCHVPKTTSAVFQRPSGQ